MLTSIWSEPLIAQSAANALLLSAAVITPRSSVTAGSNARHNQLTITIAITLPHQRRQVGRSIIPGIELTVTDTQLRNDNSREPDVGRHKATAAECLFSIIANKNCAVL
jgi:hypothetical protein